MKRRGKAAKRRARTERVVTHEEQLRRAIALLTQELLCELAYRNRGAFAIEHPARALKLRSIVLDAVVAEARPYLLGLTKSELKLEAAHILNHIQRTTPEQEDVDVLQDDTPVRVAIALLEPSTPLVVDAGPHEERVTWEQFVLANAECFLIEEYREIAETVMRGETYVESPSAFAGFDVKLAEPVVRPFGIAPEPAAAADGEDSCTHCDETGDATTFECAVCGTPLCDSCVTNWSLGLCEDCDEEHGDENEEDHEASVST